ncbi:Hypothetical predicted protein [Podarcis lilfordi]|uniref:Uncharacterized protein n=1 Tax=Podarcis lilfordi TaxID=74358 RepID=A0AA35LKW9_9SAUR|nr:Hypothetical predicted protein [Podarcis lilfordi]
MQPIVCNSPCLKLPGASRCSTVGRKVTDNRKRKERKMREKPKKGRKKCRTKSQHLDDATEINILRMVDVSSKENQKKVRGRQGEMTQERLGRRKRPPDEIQTKEDDIQETFQAQKESQTSLSGQIILCIVCSEVETAKRLVTP